MIIADRSFVIVPKVLLFFSADNVDQFVDSSSYKKPKQMEVMFPIRRHGKLLIKEPFLPMDIESNESKTGSPLSWLTDRVAPSRRNGGHQLGDAHLSLLDNSGDNSDQEL